MLVGFLVAALALMYCSLPLCADSADGGDGIKRITMETRKEAILCGKSGAECAVTPYRLCPSENGPHSAYVATPFSRVAAAVFEAMKRHARPIPMSPGEANGWGVGIYVFPGEDYDKADSIERVMIRREGETIEPETTTLAPVTLVSRAGAKKEVSKGFFAFPMTAFAPTADMAIVFVGSAGQTICTLDRSRLSMLR